MLFAPQHERDTLWVLDGACNLPVMPVMLCITERFQSYTLRGGDGVALDVKRVGGIV